MADDVIHNSSPKILETDLFTDDDLSETSENVEKLVDRVVTLAERCNTLEEIIDNKFNEAQKSDRAILAQIADIAKLVGTGAWRCTGCGKILYRSARDSGLPGADWKWASNHWEHSCSDLADDDYVLAENIAPAGEHSDIVERKYTKIAKENGHEKNLVRFCSECHRTIFLSSGAYKIICNCGTEYARDNIDGWNELGSTDELGMPSLKKDSKNIIKLDKLSNEQHKLQHMNKIDDILLACEVATESLVSAAGNLDEMSKAVKTAILLLKSVLLKGKENA